VTQTSHRWIQVGLEWWIHQVGSEVDSHLWLLRRNHIISGYWYYRRAAHAASSRGP
jgi:hypothetical protein